MSAQAHHNTYSARLWEVGQGERDDASSVQRHYSIFVMIWNMWIERNKRIFPNIKCNSAIYYHKVEYDVCFWTDANMEEGGASMITHPIRRDLRRRLDSDNSWRIMRRHQTEQQ